MATNFRNAVMSGLYGVAAIAEAQRNHRKEQAALDKAKWQARYSERDQQMRMTQQQNEYMNSQDRLAKDRDALTKAQARFQIEQDRFKEEAKLTAEHRGKVLEQSGETARETAEIRRITAESSAEYKASEAKRKRELTVADIELRKATTSKKYIGTRAGLGEKYAELGVKLLSDKRKALASQWKSEPEAILEEVEKELEALMQPWLNEYNRKIRAEKALWHASGRLGTPPQGEELSWTDMAAGTKGIIEEEMNEMRSDDVSAEWKTFDEDPTMPERFESGKLTEEEVQLLEMVKPNLADTYKLMHNIEGETSRSVEEKISKHRTLGRNTEEMEERLKALAGAKGD